jgi:hypothetical protein
MFKNHGVQSGMGGKIDRGRWVDLALEAGDCHVSEDINPLFTAQTDGEG